MTDNNLQSPGNQVLSVSRARADRRKPFSYAEAVRRIPLDEPQLKGAIGALIRDGSLEKEVLHDSKEVEAYTDAELDLLTELNEYLNETDTWFRGRSFPAPSVSPDSEYTLSAAYQDNIAAWDDTVYDALVEKGAISRHGGIHILSEDAFTAIYTHIEDPVYLHPTPTNQLTIMSPRFPPHNTSRFPHR